MQKVPSINKKFGLLFLIFFGTLLFNFCEAQVTPMAGFNFFSPNYAINKNLTTKIEILPSNDTVIVYKYSHDLHEEIAIGTPYFNNNSFFSENIFVEGSQIKGYLLYDIISEQILYSADNLEKITILKPDSFTIGNQKFKKLNESFENAFKSYYQEIYNDDYNQVFKRMTCLLKPIHKQMTGYDIKRGQIIGEFKKSSEYYFARSNRLERVKKNVNFCKQLGLFQNDLVWFAEAKNLKFDNDKDIIELMKYYNTLFNN